MSSERIACRQCGKWMFHLAVKCPHCGAPQSASAAEPGDDGDAPAPKVKDKKPELKLSAEEARALLAAEEAKDPRSGSTMTFAALAQELVMWRDGLPDVVLSVLAFPVTGATVVSLGYLLLRVRRSQRDEALAGVTLMAVPIGAGMLALTLWELDTPMAGWLAFAGGFAAWLARSVLRTVQKKDSLL